MLFATKNKIFTIIHDYPIEEYLLWAILVSTILICLEWIFCWHSYKPETYQFIKKL